jgi:hypothetical protein
MARWQPCWENRERTGEAMFYVFCRPARLRPGTASSIPEATPACVPLLKVRWYSVLLLEEEGVVFDKDLVHLVLYR